MRMSRDEYFLWQAVLVSMRATCARRAVGCVLVGSRGVMATGYNGPPSGWDHCIDYPCPGASFPSGEGLEKCEAIHAEQNALLRCDTSKIHTAYITHAPCIHCVKLLLNTPCRRIVFSKPYPHMASAEALWTHVSAKMIALGYEPRMWSQLALADFLMLGVPK